MDRSGSDRNARLLNRLKALGVAAAVLQLGAHPDDEDGGMIALMSRRYGCRVVYWSATRGEGGQNHRGAERAELLGVLRTWESLDARAIDGGEVLYGPFYDFGFSKSGADTLRRWGEQELVREMVRAIRRVQPLVVISRWSGTAADGHGHHRACGMVAAEAVAAAADPGRFPELGLPAWRTTRLYRSNAGDWNGEDAVHGVIAPELEAAGLLRLDTGVVDPVVGLTYQEQALLGINRHRTQGMGIVPEPTPFHIYYRREPPAETREQSFLDGLDPTLTGLPAQLIAALPAGAAPLLARARSELEQAVEHYRPDAPRRAVPSLLAALGTLREVSAGLGAGTAEAAYLERRQREVQEVAAACAQIRVECLTEDSRRTPGSRFGLTVRTWNLGGADMHVRDIRIGAPPSWRIEPAPEAVNGHGHSGATAEQRFEALIPAGDPPQAPYWLRAPRGPYSYVWPAEGPDLGEPLDRPAAGAIVDIELSGSAIRLVSPAVARSGFPGGSRELPVKVLPPLAIALRRHHLIWPAADEQSTIVEELSIECIEPGGAAGRLTLSVPAGWRVRPEWVDVELEAAGACQTVRLEITVPACAEPGSYDLDYSLLSDGRQTAIELNPVRLASDGAGAAVDADNCAREEHAVRPARLRVDLVDARFIHTLRYGYVEGMKNELLASLAPFGLDIATLDDDALEFSDLSEYDAIVVGPNAYNARGAVGQNAERLLQYVERGGTLIVQYQTYGFARPGLAPWPIQYSQPHDRVTDPEAPIGVLDPADPVLRFPNEITAADFEGWVHDRGMYFLGRWDRRYKPLLGCADIGEEPCEGGLLVGNYGRGTFVYAAYSFFRQVPAGVPGAIRLFANLLGLAEIRVRERMQLLSSIDWFDFLGEAERYQAARAVGERVITAGTMFAREGEPGQEMYVVVSGEVEVLKRDGVRQRRLGSVGPGEALGELALLADVPRSASLRAATDLVVLVLRYETFVGWLSEHPDLARAALRSLARKVISKD